MEISKDTKKIIEFLDYTSGNNLRKSSDLSVLLNIAATYGEYEKFNDLLLNATSLWNLHNSIKNNSVTDFDIDKMKSEIINLTDTIKKEISLIIGEEKIEVNTRFNKTYLSNKQGAFLNLIDLSHDIAELKKVINKFKSQKAK
jgi:hypothetical protein